MEKKNLQLVSLKAEPCDTIMSKAKKKKKIQGKARTGSPQPKPAQVDLCQQEARRWPRWPYPGESALCLLHLRGGMHILLKPITLEGEPIDTTELIKGQKDGHIILNTPRQSSGLEGGYLLFPSVKYLTSFVCYT